MRVRVLGCGPSTGVPTIGGIWGRCDPGDPRNRRRRVSVLVETRGLILLIDTSPDLREQLLDAGIARIDAVLMTHAHADHLHGIDDLRTVNRLMRRAIPLYADGKTLDEIRTRFGYVLAPAAEAGRFYKPTLVPHAIGGPFAIGDVPVVPFAQDHGFSTTLGHLAKTLAWIARVKPRRAVLTHMDQSLDYRELSAELPAGVEPGYDGLVIALPDPS